MKSLISFLLFTISLQTIAQDIKVMSYNIRLDVASDGENRWDARKDKVAALMNYYEADFIGGQEVQHHQLQYLQSQLANYSYIGVGRDDGKEGGEYSCIFYNNKKFNLIQQSTFWLSETPDSVSMGWDAVCHRVCTYGLFQSKESKKYFWVFNTHFDHIGKIARLQSAKLIIEKMKQLNTKNYPIIFSGDLNSKPEDEPYQYINSNLKNTRDISEQPAYGPTDTFNAFQFDKKPEGRIDHIFISNNKKLTVKKFAAITDSYDKKYPSDHFPILTTINMK